MWKRLGKRFSRHHEGSLSRHGSTLDVSKDLYLERHCVHGFPLSPSCLTFDTNRRVLFIGTSSGEIRMLGQPGAEFSGLHDDINKVVQILPFASEPSLITVCANNILHKWNFIDDEGATRLVHVRTYKFQGGLAKKITTCCLPPHGDCLFVGTLGGITYPIDTEFDGMSPEVLSWSRARAYLKYDGNDVPGEVKTLEINPANHKELLIGYAHNYLEVWDALTWKPMAYYGVYKDEGLDDIITSCWHPEGKQFVTTHTDGTIAMWSVDNHERPVKMRKPFGTDPVQDMLSIIWPEEDLMITSGGSPHSLVETHCSTILCGDSKYTLQLTSPVRGMCVLEGTHADRDSGIVNTGEAEGEGLTTNHKVLVLLLEQEILFIELAFPDLPLLRPPYLYSIHNSPMKCMEVYEDVPKALWQTISQAGRVQQELVYKARDSSWPVCGGTLLYKETENKDIIISGHEDGTLKFWDISSVSMRLEYVLKSANFFTSFDNDFINDDATENESDFVKQMCFWDPRSDDDQVQVTCLSFYHDQLLVGFKGGSLLLFDLKNQSSTVTIPLHRVSILRDDPRQKGRNWQAPMELRLDGVECAPGYQPVLCIGIFPNIPITATGFAKEQKIIGVGCMYGFAIIDSLKNTTIHVVSTFSEATDPGHLSRMQSIRKSFRQSLKRLNVRRSMRGTQSTQRSFRPAFVRSGSMRPSMKNRAGFAAGGHGAGASPAVSNEPTPMPPRRDSIRFITFAAPSHIGRHAVVPSVLVGTNQGGVLAYSIDMPPNKHRDTKSPIIMPIEREFNARKNYAIIFCGVLDHHNYLLDINDPGSYHHSSTKGGQWIVIVTEDAIKVMGLPNLKKKFRVRLKQSDSDEFHALSCHFLRAGGQSFLVLMGSDGFVSMYSLPELKLVGKEDCVDASDAFGQRNFALSPRGLLLHMRSPSEFTRGSLATQSRMDCRLLLTHVDVGKAVVVSPSSTKPIGSLSMSDVLEPMAEIELHIDGVDTEPHHNNSPAKTGPARVEEDSLEVVNEDLFLSTASPEEKRLAFEERAL